VKGTLVIEQTTPLWIAARILLQERGDDFSRRSDRVLTTFDPDDIHDLRVASRRLREGLMLFSGCYPPENFDPLLKRFKKVTRLLGTIRNTDEALLFFTTVTHELSPSTAEEMIGLLESFSRQRRKGIRRLNSGLRKLATPSLPDRFRRTIYAPSLFIPPAPGIDLLAPLSRFAKDAVTSRLADVMRILPTALLEEAAAEQHQLRIAVKHLRYRLEILSPVLGPDYPRFHELIKGFQDVLGKLHDLDVFSEIVRKSSLPAAAETEALAVFGRKRDSFFSRFTAMLVDTPFEAIAAWIVTLLR
jgi:CHAD domain-containing protein